jgi:hypothetical protein
LVTELQGTAQPQYLSNWTLTDLGVLHRELERALYETRAALAPKMREARDAGATYQQLIALSGYGSITSVVAVVKPGGREAKNAGERKRRGSTAVGV